MIVQVPIFILLLSQAAEQRPRLIAAGSVCFCISEGSSSGSHSEHVQLQNASGTVVASVHLHIAIVSGQQHEGAALGQQRSQEHLAVPAQCQSKASHVHPEVLKAPDGADASVYHSSLAAKLPTHDLHYHYHIADGAQLSCLEAPHKWLQEVQCTQGRMGQGQEAEQVHSKASVPLAVAPGLNTRKHVLHRATQTSQQLGVSIAPNTAQQRDSSCWQPLSAPPPCQNGANQVQRAALGTFEQAAKVQQAIDALRSSAMQTAKPTGRPKRKGCQPRSPLRTRKAQVPAKIKHDAPRGMNALMAFAWEMIGFMSMRSALNAGAAAVPSVPPGHVIVPAEALTQSAAPRARKAARDAKQHADMNVAQQNDGQIGTKPAEAAGAVSPHAAGALASNPPTVSQVQERTHTAVPSNHDPMLIAAAAQGAAQRVRLWLQSSPVEDDSSEQILQAAGAPCKSLNQSRRQDGLRADAYSHACKHAAASNERTAVLSPAEVESIVNVTRAHTPQMPEARHTALPHWPVAQPAPTEDAGSLQAHSIVRKNACANPDASKPLVSWADDVFATAAKELQCEGSGLRPETSRCGLAHGFMQEAYFMLWTSLSVHLSRQEVTTLEFWMCVTVCCCLLLHYPSTDGHRITGGNCRGWSRSVPACIVFL